jgi:hypothetical protein
MKVQMLKEFMLIACFGHDKNRVYWRRDNTIAIFAKILRMSVEYKRIILTYPNTLKCL